MVLKWSWTIWCYLFKSFRVLSNNDTVSVRVFNADGCFDEKSLTFNQMSLDNGVIALENSDDVDICEGDSPVGQIFGDGSGASSVASATLEQ